MGLSNIAELDLIDNAIQDISPLVNLPNLKHVWLENNPIDCVEQADNLATLENMGALVVSDCS